MKTKRPFAYKLLIHTLLTCLTLHFLPTAQAQYRVPGQDSAYALYSKIDTLQWKEYNAVFDFEKFDLNRIYELRKAIQPYVEAQDPLGEFLYAASLDLYPYGHGEPKEAQIALTYYTKAANKGLAEAERMLFDLYSYGLMGQERDEKKAFNYLQRVIKHGDATFKAKGYADLAGLFDSGTSSFVKRNKDSVIFYLEKALTYTPNDGWLLDYAAGTYEEKRNYTKAMTYLLRSDNEQSHIKVAEWLMEGKKVKKDVNQSLAILYKITDTLIKEYGKNLDGYMGGSNPMHLLNNWYRCKKWITREQLGKYFDPNWICD